MSHYQQLLVKQGITLNPYIFPSRSTSQPINAPRRKPRKVIFDHLGRRICCICDVPKSADNYTTKSKSVDGKDPRCNSCKVKLMMERKHG